MYFAEGPCDHVVEKFDVTGLDLLSYGFFDRPFDTLPRPEADEFSYFLIFLLSFLCFLVASSVSSLSFFIPFFTSIASHGASW